MLFRSIDTANQPKHYHEAGVGRGIREAVKSGLVARDDLFLQTKFTFRRGQDHRLPYDPKAPIPDQVAQSFVRSLENLGTDVIDSYVLHGPTSRAGLGPDDWAAWRAMEAIHSSGRARLLGISNVTLEQLQSLCKEARVRPRFVQNRCYAPALGPPYPPVLRRQRGGLSGFLAAHGQSHGDGPPRTDSNGRTPWSDRQPDRFPVRPRCRHVAPYRDHRRQIGRAHV